MTDIAMDAVRASIPPGKALVVHDDDALRPMLCEMLQWFGFEAAAANNGADALALLASDGPFGLFLTDVRIAGSMDGAALAATAKALYPSMLIVVITDFNGDLLHSMPEGISVLSKPFLMRDLQAQLLRLPSSN